MIPFLLVCLLLISTPPPSSSSSKTHPCLSEQQNALLQFKEIFRIEEYGYLPSWQNDTDCCKWQGVACDTKTGDVISLDVSSALLGGTIDNNTSLFLLPNLQSLNLAHNYYLSGSVNFFFFQLPKLLHLDLSNNEFNGTIPLDNSSPFPFQNLQSLSLSGNFLSGSLNFLGRFSSLKHLDLSFNAFCGIIPPQIAHLSQLRSLRLSWNNDLTFTSSILESLMQNLTHLQELNLEGVAMDQVFPSSLLNVSTTLMVLTLRNCKLRGRFLDHIFHLPNLHILDVSGNLELTGTLPYLNLSIPLISMDLSRTGFSGSIPNSISNLKNLDNLDLHSCHFTNLIPSSICSLSSLHKLVLASNKFSGFIPHCLGNLTNLWFLDMSDNQLTGPLPQLGYLTNLWFLDMGDNQLTGPLPQVGYLTNLQILDMRLNQLTGPLPKLGNSTNLLFLDMSQNRLMGPLLQSLNNCTLLEYVNISSNMLSDTFPFWLMLFPYLGAVDLGQNRFYGPIGRLFIGPVLKVLVLRQNRFSGHLPDFSGYLPLEASSLDDLDLSSNSLEGSIPKLPQVYAFLVLSNNKFTGEIPLSICKSLPLVLDLSNNSLTGTIPPCLLNLGYVINLGMNKLESAIPDRFSKDTSIRSLSLSGNQLTGPLPRSMVNCKKLVLLDLSNNNIKDSFPYWMARLPDLQVLVLQSNRFKGELKPLMDHPFLKLRLYDISNNNLTGLLPIEYIIQLDAMKRPSQDGLRYMDDEEVNYEYYYEYYCRSFLKITLTIKGSRVEFTRISLAWTSIDFSNNFFQGEIPQLIGELVALKGLNLSHNNLTGSIPLSLQNLTSLEWLDLSSNRLNGLIPSGLIRLKELSSLNLSYNELSGMIPSGQQFDTFGMESFVGNMGLCGSQVAKACGESNILEQPKLPLPRTEEDDFSVFDWEIILMGYGCGLVIGVSVGYMVFELRRPEWFVSLVEKKLLKNIVKSSRWKI